jgi:protein-L-isoaspartate(D-aspartate) O-methyltransferase
MAYSTFRVLAAVLNFAPLLAATLPCAFAYNSNNSINNNSNNMRAWTCHGTNQRDLVDRLRQANIVQSHVVRLVMEQVDRANYVPTDAYADAPQTIGLGQTISAPHMHAYVLEEMYPHLIKNNDSQHPPNVKILDVGCGSGYLTAALGRWLQAKPQTTTTSTTTTNSHQDDTEATCDNNNNNGGGGSILFPNNNDHDAPPSGKVFGIDVHPPLVEMTRQNMQKGDADLLDSGLVTLALKDGWRGWPEHAPFDAIHVGAAAERLPQDLAVQLKVGGCLIIPIGPNGGDQKLYKIERVSNTNNTNNNNNDDDNDNGDDANNNNNNNKYLPEDYRISVLLGVRYVPLVQHPEL